MKKRFGIVGMILCLLLCSCGSKEPANQPDAGTSKLAAEKEETVREQEKTYVLRDIPIPDERQELEDILPEGAEKYTLFYGLAGESVYCLTQGYPQAGSYEQVSYYIQKLTPPYEKWETFSVDMGDYLPGEMPNVRKVNLIADGTMKLLIGSEDCYYVAEWKENQDFQIHKLDIDINLGDIFDNHLLDRKSVV